MIFVRFWVNGYKGELPINYVFCWHRFCINNSVVGHVASTKVCEIFQVFMLMIQNNSEGTISLITNSLHLELNHRFLVF